MSGLTPASRGIRAGDVAITALLLAVVVYGWVAATAWPYRAALVPRIVTATGIGLCLLKLAQLAITAARTRRSADPVDDVPGGDSPRIVNEDQEDEQSLEYIFATAGGRAWAIALGWIAAFFVGLRLVGLLWITPVITILYLRTSGKTSLVAAVAYALVADAVMYIAFRQLLHIPIPRGIF